MAPRRHPRRSLDAYIDRELPPGAAVRVAQHVERCRRCRDRVRLTHRIRLSLRRLSVRVGA